MVHGAGMAAAGVRRRQVLAAALPGVLASPWARAAGPVLRVLAWPGYADADWVRAFEQKTGARVEVTVVGSDDVLRMFLADRNGPGFDVVAANTVELAALLAQGALAPLPVQRMPNAARQLPRFREPIAGTVQGGERYAVPFTYSEMGLIYDRRQWGSAPPPSLAALWDARWQGRVLAFDGSSHAFSLAALQQGLAPFALADGQWARMARHLVQLRRNLLGLYSLPEEAVDLFRRRNIAVMHANYGQQQLKLLRDAGLDVGYVVPKEGALAWLDCWAVLQRSAEQTLAVQWIEHMLDAGLNQEFSRRQGLANTLQEPQALEPAALLGPLVWLAPVEDGARREQLWQRIVAGDRLERF